MERGFRSNGFLEVGLEVAFHSDSYSSHSQVTKQGEIRGEAGPFLSGGRGDGGPKRRGPHRTAKMSPVPEGLLAPLNEGEVMDLLAYLLSGSNPKPALFFSLHDNGGHIGIT